MCLSQYDFYIFSSSSSYSSSYLSYLNPHLLLLLVRPFTSSSLSLHPPLPSIHSPRPSSHRFFYLLILHFYSSNSSSPSPSLRPPRLSPRFTPSSVRWLPVNSRSKRMKVEPTPKAWLRGRQRVGVAAGGWGYILSRYIVRGDESVRRVGAARVDNYV